MQTQTEKLTQEQAKDLIGTQELHEIASRALNHPTLKVEKVQTRLIPMVEGNAFYCHLVKIIDTRTGGYYMSANVIDALHFINGYILDEIERGTIYSCNGRVCRVKCVAVADDGTTTHVTDFDGRSTVKIKVEEVVKCIVNNAIQIIL